MKGRIPTMPIGTEFLSHGTLNIGDDNDDAPGRFKPLFQLGNYLQRVRQMFQRVHQDNGAILAFLKLSRLDVTLNHTMASSNTTGDGMSIEFQAFAVPSVIAQHIQKLSIIAADIENRPHLNKRKRGPGIIEPL